MPLEGSVHQFLHRRLRSSCHGHPRDGDHLGLRKPVCVSTQVVLQLQGFWLRWAVKALALRNARIGRFGLLQSCCTLDESLASTRPRGCMDIPRMKTRVPPTCPVQICTCEAGNHPAKPDCVVALIKESHTAERASRRRHCLEELDNASLRNLVARHAGQACGVITLLRRLLSKLRSFSCGF